MIGLYNFTPIFCPNCDALIGVATASGGDIAQFELMEQKS